MNKPEPDVFAAYLEGFQPLEVAKAELEYEKFREQVEAKKKELLTKKPWYYKLFPFKINIKLERI